MKKAIWITALLSAVFVGYVAAGPYLTVENIRTAASKHDPESLSESIEFTELRTNLKDQLNAAMMKNAAQEQKDNPYALLAAGFASKIVDGVVDTYITPAGLASIMTGKKPPAPGAPETTDTVETKKEDILKDARLNYDSHDKFSIWMTGENGKETRFILRRYGISWRLSNIVLPLDN